MADAQDLTQAFFAQIIETGGFVSADRRRGRFRSYLLGAMKHFLANEWHRAKTRKRGGQVQFIEWDDLDPEARYSKGAMAAAPADNPDLSFDREWAMETTAAAVEALREEMSTAGKGEQFEALKGSLTGEEPVSRKALAERLGISDGAVKVAVHRLRKRYRMLLRAAIAETVSGEAELDDEMRYLVLPVNLAAIRAGKNVIAVEIHQASPGSSDIAFDLGLEGVRKHDKPVLDTPLKPAREL